MQCKKCGKECMESELTNGYCSDCIKKYGINSQEIHHKENHIASVIKAFVIVIIVLGCIFGVVGLVINIAIGIVIFVATLISALLFSAIAEIIQLLEDIKNK